MSDLQVLSNGKDLVNKDQLEKPDSNLAKATVPISDLECDLLKAEHAQRRDEIVENVKRMENDHRNGLILTGAIWSWLATNGVALPANSHFEKIIIFLPAILTAFFASRWKSLNKSIEDNAEYIREKIDSCVGVELWETWLKKKRDKDPNFSTLNRESRTFWRCLIVFNLLLAVLFAASRGWFHIS